MTVYVRDGNIEAAIAELREKLNREKIMRDYIQHRHPSQRGGSFNRNGRRQGG